MAIKPIYRSIAEHAAARPDKIAVRVTGEDEPVTYARLAERVSRVAAGLKGRGMNRGVLVALTSDHAGDHLIASCAVMAAGGVPLALPQGHPAQTNLILEDARPFAVLKVGEETPGGEWTDLAEVEADGQRVGGIALERSVDPEEIAMIYYTSGTTGGAPKGVMQPYRNLEITARNLIDVTGLTGDIVELPATPTETGFWYGRCRVVLRVGGTLVLNHGSLNPLRVLGIIEKFGCNAITGDSPLFAMMVRHCEKRMERVCSKLRWLKVASAALDPDIKKRMVEMMPNCNSFMNYGLMEAMRVTLLPLRDHPDKLESMGRPCPGVSVRIRDADNIILAPGDIGEIQIKGDNVAKGYLNKEAMWAERYQEGWYATGDLGYLDMDGFLYILGRKDEAINVGGKTVSPLVIEESLSRYITRTVFNVCGATDPNGILGEVPVLCVQDAWKEDESWQAVCGRLWDNLPAAMIPRWAVLVSSIPRTASGKPQRKRLRQRVNQGLYPKL